MNNCLNCKNCQQNNNIYICDISGLKIMFPQIHGEHCNEFIKKEDESNE